VNRKDEDGRTALHWVTNLCASVLCVCMYIGACLVCACAACALMLVARTQKRATSMPCSFTNIFEYMYVMMII
jgi:hypothetical protein